MRRFSALNNKITQTKEYLESIIENSADAIDSVQNELTGFFTKTSKKS
jgi:hypothetical protein